MYKHCKKCGARLNLEAKFCSVCGTKASVPSGQAPSSPPRAANNTRTAAIKKNKPAMKIIIAVAAIVLVSIVGNLFLLRLLFGGKDPYHDGAAVEQTIKTDRGYKVGNLKKTGWQLDIPANTLEDGRLYMRVLSESESEAYKSSDFELYGTPVEITMENRENVRLGGAVQITLRIPKELQKDIAAEELFFGVYYDGNWEYFFPDNVDLKKGTAAAEIYHFSFFGFGRPSEDQQIRTFAKNFASLQWESQKQTKNMTDSLQRQYEDLFVSMGVNNSSLRTQLALDVINYLESEKLDTGDMSPISTLANMANAVSQGQAGMEDFRGQLIEFTGRALYRVMEKDPGKFASLANVTGGLSTAAGALYEGDTEGALQGIASMIRGADPIIALADTALTFVKESMETGINLWTQNEIEKAYQVYIGNAAGKYGYDNGLEGDFDAIFTTLGGGERMMKINVVKRYCEKYGKRESDLSQSERDRIVSNAMTYLKRHFDERKISDYEISNIQWKEELFIAELKKQNLLGASNYRDYFGIEKNLSNFNIGDRLARLYKLKSTVLGVMDKDVAATISDEELVKAIDQWIYWGEKKDYSGFWQYMRDMGYIKEPYKYDPTYAWVLVETLDFENAEDWAASDAHPAYIVKHGYSSGSYSASVTYEGDDPYGQGLKGTLGVQVVFSGMPQIIYPDEPVSLNLSFNTTQNDVVKLAFASAASADFDEWNLGPGAVTRGATVFVNADNKYHFVLDVNGNPTSYSETLTATIGSGGEGSRIALRTKFYMGVSMGTNYVYEWKQVN
jgi:hypothetical protein